MAFNVGAGLAKAAEGVADIAGKWAVSTYAADLEMDKQKLINEFQVARDEKQQGFTAGENEKARAFTSGESEKDRGFKAGESKLDRENRLATTSMSAGATIRAQQIASEARLAEATMTDKFRRDELTEKSKTPTFKAFEERAKLPTETQAEYDKFIASQKEPKTPYKFHANDGTPVVINEQTGAVTSGVPEGGQAGGGKRLEVSERRELKKMADPAIALTELTGTFKPTFGGAPTEFLGEAVNKYGRDFSSASPDLKERASWWQKYQRFSNLDKNELFGAALSAMEQENYKKANVTPNMQPDMIKANLKTQEDIVLTALARYSTSLIKDGYKPDSIEAITGLRFYGSDANYSKMPPGTIYIAPNGKVMRKKAEPGGL